MSPRLAQGRITMILGIEYLRLSLPAFSSLTRTSTKLVHLVRPMNITSAAAKMENEIGGEIADRSATGKNQYRSRADSSSDEETPLLISTRRGSAPMTAKNDSKLVPFTHITPLNKPKIEGFKTPPPPSEDNVPYDATVETTLRFAQARLTSPRTSNNGLARIPSTPRVKVSDHDDPFLDSPGPSWSYSVPAPRSSTKPDTNSKKGDGEKKKKRPSTVERREKIVADSEQRMRCMRKFI